MKFDVHTHHDRCGHATGKIENYILSALEKKLDVIGISDHSPFFASSRDHLLPNISMAKSEFKNYINEVIQLKKKYQGEIEVLLGVESDFFPEQKKIYNKIYQKYPMDYIIGSVHYSGKGKLFSPENKIFNRKRWKGLSKSELLEEKETFYNLIQQSAKSGVFDILGHIDSIKGYNTDFIEISTPKVEETIKVIAENNVSIEVNTSAKFKDPVGWYPEDSILEMAYHYGVDISYGSDAHSPSRVGDELNEVRKHLKNIGFKKMAFYRNRKKILIDI